MDVLEIVIAPIDLPLGRMPRAEILVNEVALTQLVEDAEQPGAGYAPLPSDTLLRPLRAAGAGGSPAASVAVLGCCCGDDRCSWVLLEVRGERELVHWEQLRTSHGVVVPVGPFAFRRAQYEAALERPRTVAAPVRFYES